MGSQEIFKQGSRTFYYSSKFFPADKLEDVTKLYAFVRVADDYVDSFPQQIDEFNKFYQEYRSAIASKKKANNPIIADFIQLANKYNFEESWTESYFESMAADLKTVRCKNLEETKKYIFGSAVVVGYMMSRILEIDDRHQPQAAFLAEAFQYINFIRDIDEDNKRNRNYFPQDELKKHGLKDLTFDTIGNNKDGFVSFINEQLDRYFSWQNQAIAAFKYIPRRYKIPLQTAVEMYAWTGRTIRKTPMVIYERKVKPTKIRIILTGLKKIIGL